MSKEQEIADALEMHNAGLGPEKIAEELQVSISTVYHYLGLAKAVRGPQGWEQAEKFLGDIIKDYLNGENMTAIAMKYNTTRYCVEKVLIQEHVLSQGVEVRADMRKTHEQVIVEAYNSNKRIVDIAVQHQVGQAQIYTILARHGIRPSRRSR